MLDAWLGSGYAFDKSCGMNSKDFLEVFGKYVFVVKTI